MALDFGGIAGQVSGAAGLVSAIRSKNVTGGLTAGLTAAKAMFGGDTDWRVKLSIPNNDVFSAGSILAPLRNAGGLVFPFTPTISISHAADYSAIDLVHQNYQFFSYQNSKTKSIKIDGTFIAEDPVSAQYWIAAVHFLRSATKMYTGNSNYQGSPPPIVKLNGYGDYVFKNVPVVIKDFTVDLPSDVDYLTTTVSDAAGIIGSISGAAGTIGGIAGALGAKGIANAAAKVGAVAGVATSVAGKVSSLFGGENGETHVPVKSTISVTVQPIYSRDAVRQFSLSDFVSGQYVKNNSGFI